MDATDFLTNHVQGYADLNGAETTAINNFSLLWSVMEGKLLNSKGNPTSLVNMVEELANKGSLDVSAFAGPLAYFRARYFSAGELTHHFRGLQFRASDKRPLVEAVLSGTDNSPANAVSALLLIVYRLRNNLFHGLKWAYDIKGQQDNFTQGAEVIMRVIEAHKVP